MAQSIKQTSLPSLKRISLNVPIYAQFKYIYARIDVDGEDPRIWFSFPISANEKESTITYLFFPYGGEEKEIIEIPIEVPTEWTG